MKHILAILALCACASQSLSSELRLTAADLRDATVLIADSDPKLARDLAEIAQAVDTLAALSEEGTEVSSVEGLLKTLDAILAREGLDPKVGVAVLLLKSQLRRLVTP
jgi:hypothetical protein